MTKEFNEVAENVQGRKRRKKQIWVTEETLKLCDRRKQMKGRRFDDKESTADYQVANRNVRHGLRIDKEKCIQEQCGNMESNLRRGNEREAFRIVKSLMKNP